MTVVVRSVAQPARVFRLNLAVEPAEPHRVAGLFLLGAAAQDLPRAAVARGNDIRPV